ncbi:hypothetical protein XTGART2_1037 [Xanthomonas translucens pv. graminis]|jgi:hypothetical protein|uniref:Uncharacterized protein n=1 Tax=Xanthomonas graminis pv. graminis TaxID=134874 RepID=A0A1M4IEM2_9XANT|nr:hypothetical protein XTG29_00805 [Xanthomonas translucens pv. graminis ART-Xtg29]SBV40377.1 hypothetical protein XTGART2_1037 [Xanthomonas translucens pv. graminis]SBV40719.1 hypothetical protein XTGART9_1054 [Xanthomonas translucens pv. graminis]SBV46443.1 hypothetical protein XTGART29_1069 [Xanthomonas translucens pv. graminis ART-Xtg29]SBV54437.1 hypothetical protein XTGART10_1049 [Xanthomonas translucens pv. graminis]
MQQHRPAFELQALLDQAEPLLLAFAGGAALLQRAHLRGHHVPGLGQFLGRHRLRHRRREVAFGRSDVAGLQAIQQRIGGLLRRGGQGGCRGQQQCQ